MFGKLNKPNINQICLSWRFLPQNVNTKAGVTLTPNGVVLYWNRVGVKITPKVSDRINQHPKVSGRKKSTPSLLGRKSTLSKVSN